MNTTPFSPFLVLQKAVAKKTCGAEKALVKIQKSCSKESIFMFSFFSSFKFVQSLSKPNSHILAKLQQQF